jgi:hypothetical protein
MQTDDEPMPSRTGRRRLTFNDRIATLANMASSSSREAMSRDFKAKGEALPSHRHARICRVRDPRLKESRSLRHSMGLSAQCHSEEGCPGARVLVATWLWRGANGGLVNILLRA